MTVWNKLWPRVLAIFVIASPAFGDCGRTLWVGPGQAFSLPSEAAEAARDGDCINIDAAGTYNGDVARWDASNLRIKGFNGRPELRAAGNHYGGKALWVITGDNVTVEYIEISGVKVPDKNGAAIRHQGRGLTLRRVYFHHNESGLLTSNDRYNKVLVEYSEIAHNGHGDGYSHNIYIGSIAEFALRFSYVHHANVGHNVKTRAVRNSIRYNRIVDEYEGNSSYLVDIPFGGHAEIVGNSFQQGRATKNKRMLAYGAESLFPQRPNGLYVAYNTLVNDRRLGGVYVWAKGGDYPVLVANNLYYGRGNLYSGPGEAMNNAKAGPVDMPRRRDFDYRLGTGAKGVDQAIEVTTAAGKVIEPRWVYRHRAQSARRRQRGEGADLGAFEHKPLVVYGGSRFALDMPDESGSASDTGSFQLPEEGAFDELEGAGSAITPTFDQPALNEPVFSE